MTSIIHEIATEFLENILETLKPHEGMKWEETGAKLMKYCKETTARFIRAAAEGLDQEGILHKERSDNAPQEKVR